MSDGKHSDDPQATPAPHGPRASPVAADPQALNATHGPHAAPAPADSHHPHDPQAEGDQSRREAPHARDAAPGADDPDDTADPYELDIRWARRSFDRASATYDAAAVLQGQVREAMLARLEWLTLEPRVVLDAGAGTGLGSRALRRRYPKAHVLAVDSSPGMLRAAAGRQSWLRRFSRVCADATRLPLADRSVDLIVSNLMLPWCPPDAVFAEFRRVLAARGQLCFTSFGPDTLKELRAAWAQVDSNCRVGRFIDMHDLGDALIRAGFAAPVLDVEHYTLTYADVHRLAGDLRALGARNAARGRLKGLTSPRKFDAMRAAYEIHRRDGRLPASCEVVFGTASAPLERAPRGAAEHGVPLEDLRRQLPTRRAP
jgi:malonyl-CoA O-methyltransferase